MKFLFEELNDALKELLSKEKNEVVSDLEIISSGFSDIEKFIGAKFELDKMEWYFLKKDIPVPENVKKARINFHQAYEQLQIQAGKRDKTDVLTPPRVNDAIQYTRFVSRKEKEYAIKLMSLDPDPKSKNPVNMAKEAAMTLEIRNLCGCVYIQNTEEDGVESKKKELIDESSKILLGPFIYLAAIKKRIGDVPGSTNLKAYCREYCKWMNKTLPEDILDYFFTYHPLLKTDDIKNDYKNFFRTFIPKRDKERGWGSELDSYRIFRTKK